ncbi:hypothetical protein BSQ33_06340 [Vibrio gazogenes]|uniref:Uncharacterized protein n=1 Tax=Vibrio gazogenes TaxID=687 RepID=A0A1Z2SJ14_VIBGA|nr:hypothetical protein BSQ33_06340 [Vibrio gazogenes]
MTGPTHNFLSIRLSESHSTIQVTLLPIKEGESEKLDADEVLSQVSSGLDEVNRELEQTYFISEIQFIPSDSRPASVYSYLTQELIKRIDSGDNFIVV